MITCPKCHQQLSDDAKFCGNCATPLTQNTSTSKIEEEDPFIGKCIDNKYYIIKRMACGGMGVVYLARQKGVGQDVAIKKLHSHLYSDKKIVERFIDEARSYGKITHPNAVKLHDLLNVNGQICLVMELVHGQTLTEFIESGHIFSIRQIIDISLQIADALATVHQAGIIHRDLKTENIMILETIPGRFSVKILDFGIAKIMDKQGVHSTQEGVLVGTPEFMSPEQCYGKAVDHRADIYAFGILMFAMICGKLPFVSDSALAMLQKQINDPIPKCERPDKSSVPPDLEAIVDKCMAKSANDRYQNFADVISDLMCIQEGKPIQIAVSTDKSQNSENETPEIIENSESESAESDKNARQNKPKPSLVLGLDISDEMQNDDDILSFSMDKDELQSEESTDEEEDEPLEFSENGDYSLGDLQPVENNDLNTTASSGGHGRLIGIICIIIAIGAGIALLKSGFFDTPSEKPTDQPVLPQAFEASIENHADLPDLPAEAAGDSTIPAPEIQPIQEVREPDPIAPCEIASRQNITLGIMLATIARTNIDLNAGSIDSAEKFIKFMTPQKDLLSGENLEQWNAVSAKLDQFKDINTRTQRAMSHYSCSEIHKILDEIPEEAEGMRNLISKKEAKCDSNASRPPSTL